MYKKPSAYRELIRAINDMPSTRGYGELIVQVEATLYLAELLGLHDEPLSVGWVLLNGTPTPSDRLCALSADQRRMIANARQIIPFNSRFAWERALARYAQIPIEHRNYDFSSKKGFHEQIIDACKRNPIPFSEHFENYAEMLSDTLAFQRRAPTYPEVGKSYSVFSNGDKPQVGRVQFDEDHLAHAAHSVEWFATARQRQPISIRLADLCDTADWLDGKEIELGSSPHWAADLRRIRFRRVDGVGVHAQLRDTETLDLDGFFHMAGMVSSGKTTLAKLIAVHVIRNGVDIRLTFIVGDTNTAVQMAHQFNTWFCGNPADSAPIAVSILGQSTRNVHLERFLVSQEFESSRKNGRAHWGERWLSPVCPLNALIRWEGDNIRPIPTGKEPCERLTLVSAGAKKNIGQEKHSVCPLFSVCPSKQMYRDLPGAKLWITTPGALSQAALPKPLDDRNLKISDVIYEQSDLVIIDEIETVVDWFDRTYADNFPLTDGDRGLIDRLDREVTTYLIANRTAPLIYQRWIFAEQAASKSITAILTVLSTREGQGLERVRRWLSRGYFTPNKLSYRLAHRLAGLKEFEPRTDLPAERQREAEAQTREVLRHFEALDELESIFQASGKNQVSVPEATIGLTDVLRQMNSAGIDADNSFLIETCRSWIMDFFPDIEEKLRALRQSLEKSTDPKDKDYLEQELLDRDGHDLAQKLFFLLWVIILDWHLKTVLNEWHHKPPEIASQQPHRRIPRAMKDILPVPALGAQFGLYRAPTGKSDTHSNPNHLTQFIYTNIGRSYILNFHRLRTDLDGQCGPNVLAMSGTSYLPDSSRFNVQHPPNGVLEPDESAKNALEHSRFAFRPFHDEDDRPIFISGRSHKEAKLRAMSDAMLRNDSTGGFLGQILEMLRQNEAREPDLWRDRARLLLFANSYTQARAVALRLQNRWPAMKERIFYLNKGDRRENQDYELDNTFQKIDIEQFATGTEGTILVAPMQSIGRGFNILNDDKIAAFGAVIFLTRPMAQPDDLGTMAQEVNRYTLQWAERQDVPDALMNADGLYGSAIALRYSARELWRAIELRHSYESLTDFHPELHIAPRRDLAATTAGLIIQATGRLLRGGVPFLAYFTDAAWAPKTARAGSAICETADTSLLQAVINVMNEYADPANAVGQALYGALAEQLSATAGLNNN